MQHFYAPDVAFDASVPDKLMSITVEPNKVLVICADGPVPADWTAVDAATVENEYPGMLDAIAHPVPYENLKLFFES